MSIFTRSLTISMFCAGLASAQIQTQVDLSRQTKSADLSNVGPTKPAQTGTVLPGTCSTGQVFFKTNAVPGANLYACTASNTWTAFFTGAGSLSNSGFGVPGNLPVYLDNSGTQLADSGVAGSPATLVTKVNYQAGTSLDCIGQTGDTASAMSCLLNPTLNGYGLHMPLRFTPQIANSGPFTLNIDSLGATAVKKPDCVTDPDAGYFQPGQTYQLIYNGSVFCEAHGGSNSSVTPAAPYLRIGSAYYLPFAYPAKLPPVSGWTGVNFTGATFTTTGAGGVVQIQSASSRTTEALNLQVLPIGSTQTLVAAIASGGMVSATPFGGCGVGAYNSISGASYVLLQQLQASARLLEAGYTSPTVQTFAGNVVLSAVGAVVYLQLQISGSNVITSYSTTGAPGSWIQINSRALGSTGMPASVDSWAFFAEPSGTSQATCQLLSWSTF